MKLFFLIILILLTAGCAHNVVGGATTWKNGKETEKVDVCMANCISKAEDGIHCSEFNQKAAISCKEYLKK